MNPSFRLSFRVGVCLVLAGFAAGCGHSNAEERQLADMQDEVTRIAAERDREDQRLSALEVEAAARKEPARSDNVPRPVPPQRTRQVGPDGSEQMQESSETASALDGDDTTDTTPRPSIRVQGSAARGKGAHGGEVVQETLPDEAPNGGAVGPPIRANAPPSSALDAEARRSYDAALALVNGHQYDKALDAFAAFLVRWPDHPNADNAMYWRGECYFARGEFARAAEEFEGTIARFPLGNKVPDALLKLGICQQKLGNPTKAKTYFDRLLRDFPRSEAARRIPTGDGAARHGVGPEESP
jgi:tol-pal system protein YbgF